MINKEYKITLDKQMRININNNERNNNYKEVHYIKKNNE